MDDLVLRAMTKWPNVPDCYGWLGLDARGDWYMRDEAAQASGAFASGEPGAKGSRLQHIKLIEFINRNYGVNDKGAWFFQNGPQRVYVDLEVTPYVWRVDATGAVSSNAGEPAVFQKCLMDEFGWAYLQTSSGFGLVHTQDVASLAQAIESKQWQVESVLASDLPTRFGYVRSPKPERDPAGN